MLVLSPVPTSVTACPGLAEAFAASAGVPLIATPVTLDRLTVNGALTPPAVFTTIGPNAASLHGTVMHDEPLYR